VPGAPLELSQTPCGAPPYFTVLPLAKEDIVLSVGIGGIGGHSSALPSSHAGIITTRAAVPAFSPGKLQVLQVSRVVTRIGSGPPYTDYAIEFAVCKDVRGHFGHISTLPAALEARLEWGNCRSYSIDDRQFETCGAQLSDVTLAPGDTLGTAGGQASVGTTNERDRDPAGEVRTALDFGLRDLRTKHAFIAADRYSEGALHAICPWEVFDDTNRDYLLGTLRGSRAEEVVGEPRCGTMQVDVPGTAKGVWAPPAFAGPAGGPEAARFITLADYPARPQEKLALGIGPLELGGTLGVVPRETTGRVNRAFEHLIGDGLVYCYGGADTPFMSWFVSLAANATLTIEKIDHAEGAGPCASAPESWSFGEQAMTFTR
jgi:hypothetical protein